MVAGTATLSILSGGSAPDVPGTAPQYPNRVFSFTEPAAQLNIRDQSPNDFQTEIVRPIPVTAGDPNSLPPAANRGLEARRNAWRRTPPARRSFGRVLRRFRARSRPAAAGPREFSRLPSRHGHYQGVASPFDPTQFRLPTLGLPPGLGTPEPTPEIKKRVRAIRRARNRSRRTRSRWSSAGPR